MFPWAQIWQPSARDLTSLFALPLFRNFSNTLNAALITHTFDVPVDFVLLLQTWHSDAIRGGAAVITDHRFEFRDQSDNVVSTLAGNREGGRAFSEIDSEAILLVPPNTRMVALVTFDVAAAANNLRSGISGWLLPRGNLPQA